MNNTRALTPPQGDITCSGQHDACDEVECFCNLGWCDHVGPKPPSELKPQIIGGIRRHCAADGGTVMSAFTQPTTEEAEEPMSVRARQVEEEMVGEPITAQTPAREPDVLERALAWQAIQKEIRAVLFEVRLLRHGKVLHMPLQFGRFYSIWKDEGCGHRRGHGSYHAAEQCLEKRARAD